LTRGKLFSIFGKNCWQRGVLFGDETKQSSSVSIFPGCWLFDSGFGFGKFSEPAFRRPTIALIAAGANRK